MKNLKFGITALLLGAASFSNLSFATEVQAPTATHPIPVMHETMHNCVQYQRLTANQKIQVGQIMHDLKSKIKPLREQLFNKEADLNKQFMAPTPNEAAINLLTKEISNLESQMFAAHIQARLEMSKVGFASDECWKNATPAQMSQMLERHKQMIMQHGSVPNAPFDGVQSGSSQGVQTAPEQGLQSSATQGLSSNSQQSDQSLSK